MIMVQVGAVAVRMPVIIMMVDTLAAEFQVAKLKPLEQ